MKKPNETQRLEWATLNDARFLWKLRNAAYVREQSNNTEKIKWRDHLKWLRHKLDEQDHDFWIIKSGKKRFGYCRVDSDGLVSIAIDKRYHNMGIATTALKILPARPMVAQIRVDNKASIKAFNNAGFDLQFVLLKKEKRE